MSELYSYKTVITSTETDNVVLEIKVKDLSIGYIAREERDQSTQYFIYKQGGDIDNLSGTSCDSLDQAVIALLVKMI